MIFELLKIFRGFNFPTNLIPLIPKKINKSSNLLSTLNAHFKVFLTVDYTTHIHTSFTEGESEINT